MTSGQNIASLEHFVGNFQVFPSWHSQPAPHRRMSLHRFYSYSAHRMITLRVQDDIIKSLRMSEDHCKLVHPFNRSNLFYEVSPN